eukprot:scaffold57710_cov62-Phaeocystis_antarctica.AAC.3
MVAVMVETRAVGQLELATEVVVVVARGEVLVHPLASQLRVERVDEDGWLGAATHRSHGGQHAALPNGKFGKEISGQSQGLNNVHRSAALLQPYRGCGWWRLPRRRWRRRRRRGCYRYSDAGDARRQHTTLSGRRLTARGAAVTRVRLEFGRRRVRLPGRGQAVHARLCVASTRRAVDGAPVVSTVDGVAGDGAAREGEQPLDSKLEGGLGPQRAHLRDPRGHVLGVAVDAQRRASAARAENQAARTMGAPARAGGRRAPRVLRGGRGAPRGMRRRASRAPLPREHLGRLGRGLRGLARVAAESRERRHHLERRRAGRALWPRRLHDVRRRGAARGSDRDGGRAERDARVAAVAGEELQPERLRLEPCEAALRRHRRERELAALPSRGELGVAARARGEGAGWQRGAEMLGLA